MSSTFPRLLFSTRCVSVSALTLLLAACSHHEHMAADEDESVPSSAVDASDLEAAPEATHDAGSAACTEGASEPCICAEGGVGTRVCSRGTPSACTACTATRSSKCVAGHYTGHMSASYVPTPAGLCGLITLFGGEGSATIEFDLEASGELFTVVGASCIQLSVMAADGGSPDEYTKMGAQKMALRGQVDCDTGEFKGEVRGTYSSVSLCDLGSEKQSYFFKGPVSARFNPETRAFEAGKIVLREPPVLIPLGGEAGGEGTWSATLNPDAGSRPAREDCLGGVRFPDELFPDSGDAGI